MFFVLIISGKGLPHFIPIGLADISAINARQLIFEQIRATAAILPNGLD
jgi:hypothetical protein